MTAIAIANATDCHHHVYDARYPVAPGAWLVPPDASVSQYRQVRERLGTSRDVVVQPSTYGTDNSLLLAALRELGSCARGVAVVAPGIDAGQLRELHEHGVRAVRFNFRMGSVEPGQVAALAARIAEFGWHVELLAAPEVVQREFALLSGLPVPLVLDHLALLDPAGGSRVGQDAVWRLIDGGATWVKLSGPDVFFPHDLSAYPSLIPVGRLLVERVSERLVWGSNWPHPTTTPDSRPDPAVLLDLLAAWAPASGVRRRILVDNPGALYDFDPTPTPEATSAREPTRAAEAISAAERR